MRRKNLYLFSICFILALSFLPVKLSAAPYYEGKTIRIIVGHAAGGGYDRITRIIAKYLPKYIPGEPTVYVENMPGGGTIIAANYLYNIAKPDGLTIGLTDRGLPFAQILKAKGIKFDLRKFQWLGSPFQNSFVLGIRTDLPYKTYAELLKAKTPIQLGSSGPATTDYQYPALLKEFTGLNCNIVIYKSGAASSLAVERKEVDGKAASYGVLHPYINRGEMRALIRGRVSQPEIADLPLDEDMATSKMGKTLLAMFSSVNQAGRVYSAPPGTPPEALAALRSGMAKALENPELKATFLKMGERIEYVPPEVAEKLFNFVLDQPEEVVREFARFIKF